MKFHLAHCSALLLLLLSACIKDDPESLRKDTLILTGIMEAGKPAGAIEIFTLNNDGVGILPVSNADVSIMGNGETSILEWNGHNYENSSSDMIILEETNYSVEVRSGDHFLSGNTRIPPAIQLISATDTIITVDSESDGTTVFTASWNQTDGFEYFFELICDEAVPEVIPFPVTSGNFQKRFKGPTANSGLFLLDTDFSYYGQHRLLIHRVPVFYSNFYFFNPAGTRGYLQAGYDNINGGRGCFAGMTTRVIHLEINP
ncbi:MAG: DUF4249 family protein [Crocinitomicaceae bacterium]|nr:DUF4249 family protein [Crocinitomicaceae bacterium]